MWGIIFYKKQKWGTVYRFFQDVSGSNYSYGGTLLSLNNPKEGELISEPQEIKVLNS